MDKIAVAKQLGKPIDGHAPGLMGEDAKKYIEEGISTDHECYMLEEALDKLKYGMKILIREGSAAKNFEALHTLIPEYTDRVMFCSDDKHPNDLVVSQIDGIVRQALERGYDLFDVLKCACINPIEHYNLDVGFLKEGDPADFIVVNNTEEFKVLATFIDGIKVAEDGKSKLESVEADIVNNFHTGKKTPSDFAIKANCAEIRIIEAENGELITNEQFAKPKVHEGDIVSDIENDVLKLAVVCRYNNEKPAIAFIKNFGLTKGAIASCVAHDSHNIIAVGVTDEEIADAVNAVIEEKGGISLADNGKTNVLPLPIAGIMTNANGYETAEKYSLLDAQAKELGSKLTAPYMTLSFMALLVIPALKLSDRGLFDGRKFELTELCN
jgi:adenine deaminase